MKKRTAFSILVVVLVFISMACSIGDKKTPPLGEEYRSESGGFLLQKINGYNFEDSLGIVNMTSPDGTVDMGPGVMVFGGLMETETSNEDLLETMKTQNSTIEVGKSQTRKVGGVKGLYAPLSGEYNGIEVKGALYVAMYTPYQEFVALALGPKEEWKELDKLFDALLDSVQFFDATEEIASSYSGGEEVNYSDEPQLIYQWAIEAYAETEYTPTDWSASQATGAPDVDVCQDDARAWASAYADGQDSIELIYEIPVNPIEINIYQSFNPSQVVEVDIIDIEGTTWIAWTGEPEVVDSCPDLMTISIELDEPLYINRVVVYVDQSVLGIGYTEIDAVELVGYTSGGETQATTGFESNDEPQIPEVQDDLPVPHNYSGWMAGPVYQGWVNIIINETRVEDLDEIMTITGKRSTENWKPRADHADTFIYDMGPEGMKGYISVTTEGIVYKKSLTPTAYPDDYALATVNQQIYAELDAIYKRDYVIPYAVMANMLESPGLLREQYHRPDDDTMVAIYEWLAANGDRISGAFYNGKLTGMAGLAYIPAE